MYATMLDVEWPDGFEEIAWLARTLKAYGYTVSLEVKVLASHDGPRHRVSIVKWGREPNRLTLERTEIGTYGDKTEATNMIRFLLNISMEQHRHRERLTNVRRTKS